MFGEHDVDDRSMDTWLDLLRQAEPETRRGELVVRNLLDDANVCAGLRKLLFDFVGGETVATTPEDTVRQYEQFSGNFTRKRHALSTPRECQQLPAKCSI